MILDTNVLVACALLPHAAPRRCLAVRECVDRTMRHARLLLSGETLAELAEVLRRAVFDAHRPRSDREEFLAEIEAIALRVDPTETVTLCRDPDDDMFLSLALAGDADWLVTLDKRLLAVRGLARTRIVRPERFLSQTASWLGGEADGAHNNRAASYGIIVADREEPRSETRGQE